MPLAPSPRKILLALHLASSLGWIGGVIAYLVLGVAAATRKDYWVLVSLALTVFCVVILVLHMPTVSATAQFARDADSAALSRLGGDLFHPGVGLLILVVISVLNGYKPRGLTRYGWKKQKADRTGMTTGG